MPLRHRKYDVRRIDTVDRSPRKSSREEKFAVLQQVLLNRLSEDDLGQQEVFSHPSDVDQIRQALSGPLDSPPATVQPQNQPGLPGEKF